MDAGEGLGEAARLIGRRFPHQRAVPRQVAACRFPCSVAPGPPAKFRASASQTEVAYILSISYDQTLLRTRELLLEQMGHRVASAEGFAEAYRFCSGHHENFDLIVLGHSIPHEDKRAMISQCVHSCSCPVLALLRSNEPPVEEATRSVATSDPRAFLDVVQELIGAAVPQRG